MNDLHAAALLHQFGQLVPEMVLALFACILFVGGAFAPSLKRSSWGVTTVAALLLALLALLLAPAYQVAADAPFVFDWLAFLTRLIAIGSTLVLVALSWDEVPERQVSDYHACLLVIALGAGLVGAANDLVGMFIALELVSIPTYVLLYLPRHDEAAQEAAMKYFLLSILSAALVLFGFSYLYGLGGTTNLAGLQDALVAANRPVPRNPDDFSAARNASGIALVALIMVVAGLGFNITAVPFHFYAPDVYQGTSAGAAAFLAMIPKLAGFAALLRVLGFVVPDGVTTGYPGMALTREVPVLLWFLAVITMSLGNVLAILQDNLPRLLAYSSVAHAGYMLVALASAPYLQSGNTGGGVSALLYYLVAYGAMTVGVFTVIGMLDRPERPVETVDDLAGLSRSHPGVAFMLTILLFSLIGIPLTAGFTGKLLIFFGAISVPDLTLYRVLAVIGVLNAAVGAWYYLRIISAMYLRTAVRPVVTRGTMGGFVALAICVILTVGLSVPPGANWLLRAARTSPAGPGPAAQLNARP
jgi:NADH-quinone oxidoreductase subunit N